MVVTLVMQGITAKLCRRPIKQSSKKCRRWDGEAPRVPEMVISKSRQLILDALALSQERQARNRINILATKCGISIIYPHRVFTNKAIEQACPVYEDMSIITVGSSCPLSIASWRGYGAVNMAVDQETEQQKVQRMRGRSAWCTQRLLRGLRPQMLGWCS